MARRLATAVGLLAAAFVGVGGCGDGADSVPRFEPERTPDRNAYVDELNDSVARVQSAFRAIGRAGGDEQLAETAGIAAERLRVVGEELEPAAERLRLLLEKASGRPVAPKVERAHDATRAAREDVRAARETLEAVHHETVDGVGRTEGPTLAGRVADARDDVSAAAEALTEARVSIHAAVESLQQGEEAGGSAFPLALGRQARVALAAASEELRAASRLAAALEHALERLPSTLAVERLKEAAALADAADGALTEAEGALLHLRRAFAAGPQAVAAEDVEATGLPERARVAAARLAAAAEAVDEAIAALRGLEAGRLPSPAEGAASEARDRLERADGHVAEARELAAEIVSRLESGPPDLPSEDLAAVADDAVAAAEDALGDDAFALLRLREAIDAADELRVDLLLAGLEVVHARLRAVADDFADVTAPEEARDTHPMVVSSFRRLAQDVEELKRFLEDASAGRVALENVIEDLARVGLEGAVLFEEARWRMQEKGIEVERIEAGS